MSVSTRPDSPAAPDRYAFDNNDPEAVDRHRHLAAILDEPTRARIRALGDLTGRRCLEVGAGGGAIAGWLADQVGPTGRVLATDINIRHIPPHPGYEVLRHDLVEDPVPAGPWDIIHARLVLLHIPQRHDVLRRLAAALAPGGALIIEEWETTFGKIVLDAPTPAAADLVERYHRLLIDEIMPTKGNDPTWAGQVLAAMRAQGLTDVDTLVHARSWPGGTAGALLVAANIAQLRAEFIDAGLSAADQAEIARLVSDPRLVVRGHLTYSTVGRRAPL